MLNGKQRGWIRRLPGAERMLSSNLAEEANLSNAPADNQESTLVRTLQCPHLSEQVERVSSPLFTLEGGSCHAGTCPVTVILSCRQVL